MVGSSSKCLCFYLVFAVSVVFASGNSLLHNEVGGLVSYSNTGSEWSGRFSALSVAPVYHYYFTPHIFAGPVIAYSLVSHEGNLYDASTYISNVNKENYSEIDLGVEVGYGIPLGRAYPYVSVGAAWIDLVPKYGSARNMFGLPATIGVKLMVADHLGFDIQGGYAYITSETANLETPQNNFEVMIGLLGKF